MGKEENKAMHKVSTDPKSQKADTHTPQLLTGSHFVGIRYK